MSLKINTRKFESHVAGVAQHRPIGRKAESKKNNESYDWIAFYFCKDKRSGAEYAVIPQDRLFVTGNGGGRYNLSYIDTNGHWDRLSYGYFATSCEPISNPENSKAYAAVKADEDRRIIALTESEFDTIVDSDDAVKTVKSIVANNYESKKSEATSFGAGMSKRTDFSKMRNLGDILDALEEHRKLMESKATDLSKSKEDLKASIKALNEFSEHVLFLKQQSVKGIKDAIAFNKSPEVKAAADVEKHLKDALKILYSDYENIPDVTQLLTVIDSRYATRGDKVVVSWVDNADRAIEVDSKTIKDSIAAGDISEDDVVKLVTVTSVTHGVKNKDTVEKLTPVLERMNALLMTAPKIEEAVIDPKEFKELRDLVEQIVKEASTPKDTIKTTITTLSKGDIDKIRKESFVSEGLLDKLKELVSTLKDKISSLWNSFTSLFFSLEDEALESADTFAEVEETFAIMGIVVESYVAKRIPLGKQFEVLTKSVLHCCDRLVKDTSLAGEFDDEVIYTEEAVKNAVESFQAFGEACKTLKNALSYHKNEDNMNVIGILADAITQIVNDDNGGSVEDDSDSEEDEDSVINRVEREYSPEDGEEGEEGGAELPGQEPEEEPGTIG